MVIDFSSIDIKDDPVLILKTVDGTKIGVLGYANNIKGDICYNETSKITFDVPAYVKGVKTPSYDDVIGMRIIDLAGYGQFILTNPKVVVDGIKVIKSCTAYSLEFEFTYKKLSLESATYNFWNPVAQSGTILKIILDKMPSWSVGTISSTLIGKYRTFDISDENLYNFMKSTLQETYNCIFEFDTYNRKINVRDVSASVPTNPVYVSFDNLAKEISVEEDTENIFTCLDVNGAEGVDIRSVNPMGTNKIYNLDYFMTTTNFTSAFITKWNNWKTTFANNQLPYYNLTVEQSLQTSRLLTEQAALVDLQGELTSLENIQAVIIQGIAQNLKTQADLDTVNDQIDAKNLEISDQEALITSVKTQITTITTEMVAINTATAFSSFFTSAELLILNKYFKEDSVSESSFVAPTVKTYNTADISNSIAGVALSVSSADITSVANSRSKDIYDIDGGDLTIGTTSANIISSALERDSSGNFVFTAYIGNGTVDGTSFESGCISMTGVAGTITNDLLPDDDTPSIYVGTELSFTVTSARFYFTENTTEYEQRYVEWELFDYGMDCLEKLAYPSYSFSADMINFLALKEFASFKNEISLGQKIYLEVTEGTILQPIAVKISIDFDKLDNFSIEFGDKYCISDQAFELKDLLKQSISMGKSVDFSKYTYSAFTDSGAESEVSRIRDSALDVSKNAILSSSEQAVSWDGAGIRLRKWADEAKTLYDPKQIWMNNNSIMFTSDNWASAEIAIGEFVDGNLGSCWGVVAPNIVGTLLAGNNLVIESEKQDGGISVFKVDASGASLHNAVFDIYNGTNTQISLNPFTGFAIGAYPLYSGDTYTINETNAKLWCDTSGNLHLKGKLEGATGTFSGALSAATGTFAGDISASTGTFKGIVRASDFQTTSGTSMLTSGKFKSEYLSLSGMSVVNGYGQTTFSVASDGTVTINGNVTMNGGSIAWGSVADNGAYSLAANASSTADSASNDAATAQSRADSAYSKATDAKNIAQNIADGAYAGTFIDGTMIYSPEIWGGSLNLTGDSTTGKMSLWANANEIGYLGYYTSSDIGGNSMKGVELDSSYALKLNAGTDLSIDADIGNTVYIGATNSGQSIAIGGDSSSRTVVQGDMSISNGNLYVYGKLIVNDVEVNVP